MRDYLYMEDLDNPLTRKFIDEQNRRLKKYLGDYPEKLYPRVLKYLEIPVVKTFAVSRRGVYYVLRTKDSTKIILHTWSGRENTIVDSRELGEDAVIISVESDEEGERISYFYTMGGSDEGKLVIMNTMESKVIDELEGSVGNVVWLGEYDYYYTRMYRRGKTPDGVMTPAERVFHRNIISKKEEMVYGNGLETNYMITVSKPWSSRKIFITVYKGWESSKIYWGEISDPSTWKLLYDGGNHLVEPIGYHVGKEASYIMAYDGNGMGRILEVKDKQARIIVDEKEFPLEKALLTDDYIFTVYLKDASAMVQVYDIKGTLLDQLSFDSPSTITMLQDMDGKIVFMRETFQQPPMINAYDPKSKKLETIIAVEKGRINARIKEGWVYSRDNTRIHYFMLESNNRGKASGLAIVYGYGGFGVSLTPGYMTSFYPFLEDGGTIIIANLRGGGEYGEKWHEAGKKHYKQNVFDDYKAVLEEIRRKGYKTIGWGGSNGGLLVGATMLQAPHLFNAAIIGYPVLDMLRFHKLYIGRLWTTEYGDPEDPKDREYLLTYSPMHNIKPNVKYPPTLVYTGLHDDRVHPSHALRFVAKLLEIKAPVYLRVETKAGHLGATPDTKAREISDILAFIYKTLSE